VSAMSAMSLSGAGRSDYFRMKTLPARVSAHAPQNSLSPSPYFLADLTGNIILSHAQFFKVHDKEAQQGSDSVSSSLFGTKQSLWEARASTSIRHVCWCMLTDADVRRGARLSPTLAAVCQQVSLEAGAEKRRMLTYAGVCWRVLTYAGVCWCLLGRCGTAWCVWPLCHAHAC
jgi:hypothetical protein